jgi:hypothetical protein
MVELKYMNCKNHPDREAVTNCAVCGKPVCQECLIEIAGTTYCKDCVSELVTASIVEKTMKKAPEEKIIPEPEENVEPVQEELVDEVAEEGDYDFENQFEEEEEPVNKPKFRSAARVSSILEEEGFANETASLKEETPVVEEVSEELYEIPEPEVETYEVKSEEQSPNVEEGPDEELEAKYEKYLEDLYYDEPEVSEEPVETSTMAGSLSLQDQLAQDEAKNGPLTNKPLIVEEEENVSEEAGSYINNENFTPSLTDIEDDEDDVIVPVHMQNAHEDKGLSYEEIRLRILEEQGLTGEEEPETNRVQTDYADQQEIYESEMHKSSGRFHRAKKQELEPQYYADETDYYMNYPEEDLTSVRHIHQRDKDEEKFSVAEIILTIILIVLILIVISYVIYLFTLSGDYPTYIDAVMALISNPMQVITNIFN